RRHAELTPDDGSWYINDLTSANGTYVNGTRVAKRLLLQPGDQIRTGNTLLLFGIETQQARSTLLQNVVDAHVESVFASNDDSLIMAVPDPTEAAVVQLKVIYELTQLIASIADREELLERVMDLILEYFKADRGFILLQDEPDTWADPVIMRHRIPLENDQEQRIAVSHTIVKHVLAKGEAVLSSNAMSDERFAPGDSVQRYGIRSALCAPIKFKDNICGVIHLDSQIINYTFTEDQLRLLTAIGVHTGLALANAQLYGEQIQRERLAAMGQTVATLSHSIRNMLQGLRGGADVVELGLRKNSLPVLRNGWGIVARNLDRIYGLTMNMLAYSKQRKPELEMTNLNNLTQEVIQLVQQRFDNKSVALIADLEQEMPPVPIDPTGIHQALMNLVNNALDATEPQTGVVSLGAKYDPDTHTVQIRVSDNGMGMDRAHLNQLFQPFRSTKGQGGTGLGLVVTKKVIEEHGGSIAVDSSPQQGTTFTLMLPTQSGTSTDTVGT
ncbi:MAG: ATP-binding protein, partial [Pirellulaceae bacterium]|nr:ATP-binding protein [Pirellulaceae bacterium]